MWILTVLIGVMNSVAFCDSGFIDPLFEKMQGDWKGHGEQIRSRDGRRIRLEVQTHSEVEEGQLKSINKVREWDAQKLVRVYTLSYSFVSSDKDPQVYQFLYNTGVEVLQFPAFFWGDLLEVVQRHISQNGDVEIESRIRFVKDGSSDYFETIFLNKSKISESRIRYERISIE
jgi:hypothetical protein